MDNNGKAVKSGIWYTVSNFLVKGLGLITTPLFSRLLTKAEYGMYNNYSSWLSIMAILVTMYLESSLISARFDFEQKLDEYIFSVLALSASLTLFWIVIINSFITFFSSFMNLDPVFLNIMMVYLLFLPGINFYIMKERYCFEYKKTIAVSLIVAIGGAFLSVILVLFLENKLWGRVIGSVIPTCLLGLFFFFCFFVKGKRIVFKYWKYALVICLPYIPHLLSMTVLNSTDRIMINSLCGAEDAALYSLAYTCGAMISILVTSINGAFSPWLGEKLHEEQYFEIKKVSKYYVLGFFFVAIGIMLVSPEILLILGGKAYWEALNVMPPVAMGCFFQLLYTMFVNIEQYSKKTGGMAVASVIAALLNFGLNLLFIPRFGFLAAAYTTLVGYLSLLLMHMYLVHRINYSNVYNYKFFLFVVLVGIVMMILISMLYAYTFVRYVVISIYIISACLIVFRYRRSMILVFKKPK